MDVIPFPIPKERALDLLRETAQSSSRVVTPTPPPEWGDWRRLVNRREIILCLQRGELIGGPLLDEYSNWRCVLRCFCSEGMMEITASLFQHEGEWRIFVSEAKYP